MPDVLQTFLFKDRDVRGAVVRLHESYETIMMQHHYPPILGQLLGEALLGVILMASTFKKKGKMTLQFQGEGALSLLSTRITHDDRIRGLIRAEPNLISNKNLAQALEAGQLTLTCEGETTAQRYQSIVPVSTLSIATALQEYFTRSEQIATHFILFRQADYAAGLMLQALPQARSESIIDDFEHAVMLAQTLQPQELFHLDFAVLLKRLYAEDDLVLFPPRSLQFGCDCTLEKMQRTLFNLGKEEANAILSDRSFIEMTCDFCGQHYTFDADEVALLFNDQPSALYH